MATEEKVYIPRFARLEGAHGELVLSTDELGEAAEFWLTDLDGFFGGVGVQAHDVQRKIGHSQTPRCAPAAPSPSKDILNSTPTRHAQSQTVSYQEYSLTGTWEP